jgi:hypothetical protein
LNCYLSVPKNESLLYLFVDKITRIYLSATSQTGHNYLLPLKNEQTDGLPLLEHRPIIMQRPVMFPLSHPQYIQEILHLYSGRSTS